MTRVASIAVALAVVLWAGSADAGKGKPRHRSHPAGSTPPAQGDGSAAASDEESVTITSTPPPPAPSAEPARPERAPTPASAPPIPQPRPPHGDVPPTPTETSGPDLGALRAEYEALRDALFRSRARAQAVEDATSTTRLAGSLRWKAPKGYVARRAQIRLDDAVLMDAGDKPLGSDPAAIVERGVAPGRHTLAVRLEIRGAKDDKLGYTSEQTFVLDLPAGKTTDVEILTDEDGDLPEYRPLIRVEPRTRK